MREQHDRQLYRWELIARPGEIWELATTYSGVESRWLIISVPDNVRSSDLYVDIRAMCLEDLRVTRIGEVLSVRYGYGRRIA